MANLIRLNMHNNHQDNLTASTDSLESHVTHANSVETPKQKIKIHPLQPHLVRSIKASQAHQYLGMNRHRFDQLVRPCLVKISLGKKGAVYDRLDLDAWFEQYKSCNGRPAGEPTMRGKKPWDENERPVSISVRGSGILKNKYKGNAFAKAQDRIRSKKALLSTTP